MNAITIAFNTLNAMQTVFRVEINRSVRKMRKISSILKKTVRYFDIEGDISTFKRNIHCILHAECYARQFRCRKEQTCARNATIYAILKKTMRYFAIVGDISPFKRYFHGILHAECYENRF